MRLVRNKKCIKPSKILSKNTDIATGYNYIKTVRMLDNEKVLFDWLLDL